MYFIISVSTNSKKKPNETSILVSRNIESKFSIGLQNDSTHTTQKAETYEKWINWKLIFFPLRSCSSCLLQANKPKHSLQLDIFAVIRSLVHSICASYSSSSLENDRFCEKILVYEQHKHERTKKRWANSST